MEIREADFEEMVADSDRPVLVDFWASWCPPCKMMQPVVDKLATKVADWADVYSINIDRSPGLAGQFQVSGVPTFISFAGGQAIDRKTGALTEGQLVGLLEQARDAMPETTHDEDDSDTAQDRPWITVVSGLPRSGTSMMMRMLEAGGLPVMTDDRREADVDNPNGYYEFEDVKSLEENADWLTASNGHAVKMVYRLLRHLPAAHEYRIVFMRRNTDEILSSQKKMLERSGITTDIPDEQMKALYERELQELYAWLPSQPHLNLVNVSYNDLLSQPVAALSQVNRHMDFTLDVDAMAATIDPNLYRNRAA